MGKEISTEIMARKWLQDPHVMGNLGLAILGITLTAYTTTISLPIWLPILVGTTSTFYLFLAWMRLRTLLAKEAPDTNVDSTRSYSTDSDDMEEIPVVRHRMISQTEVKLLDTTYRYGRSNPPPSQEEQDARWEDDRDSNIFG